MGMDPNTVKDTGEQFTLGLLAYTSTGGTTPEQVAAAIKKQLPYGASCYYGANLTWAQSFWGIEALNKPYTVVYFSVKSSAATPTVRLSHHERFTTPRGCQPVEEVSRLPFGYIMDVPIPFSWFIGASPYVRGLLEGKEKELIVFEYTMDYGYDNDDAKVHADCGAALDKLLKKLVNRHGIRLEEVSAAWGKNKIAIALVRECFESDDERDRFLNWFGGLGYGCDFEPDLWSEGLACGCSPFKIVLVKHVKQID